MSLLAQLLVAWFGINLLILALMWHNANERRRRRQAYERERQYAPGHLAQPGWPSPTAHTAATLVPAAETPAPEGAPPAAEPSRVVVMVNGDVPVRRPRVAPPVLQAVRAPAAAAAPAPCNCDCHALRAEIRHLRLTVAELSIDRASLMAKLQPRQPLRAKPWQRSAAARP